VAAIPPGAGSGQRGGGGGQRGGSWRGKKKQGRGGGGGGGGGQQVSHTLTHADQARVGSGLCFSHFCYGAKAKRCDAPCNWPGS
jgi:hypothetical protein